jgi:ketosteroid isomerase-like protein
VSQENVEIVRASVAAWNRRDGDLWLSYFARDAEWVPAAAAAVGVGAVYRGGDEMTRWRAGVWEAWDVFELSESEVRDLGDSVLWLGRATMRGRASQISLDEAGGVLSRFETGKIVRGQTFLSWPEALKAVGIEG